MSFIKLSVVLLVILLFGCSSKNDNRLPGCSPHGPGALLCLSSVVVEAVDTNPSQQCSDMRGEKKQSCDAQVASLKKHISDASRK